MTPHEGANVAISAIVANTRGMLDSHEVGSAIIALLALRRASAESLARLALAHDPERALDESLTRVSREQPDLGEALSTLLHPVRRERASLAALLRSVDSVGDMKPSELFIAFTKLLADQAKKGGVAVVPPNVARLVARLAIEREGMSVCDPSCGAGLLLAAVANEPDLRPAALQGWERNVGAVALARAIYGALGIDAHVGAVNALVTHPTEALFDAVVSAPPFGLQPPPQLHLDASSRFRFGVPTRHADWLFAQNALSSLAPRGTAVLLMSKGPLLRASSELEIRRGLLEADVVDTVVGLPPGLLPGTAIPSFLVVLRRDRPAQRRGAVLFVEVSTKDPGTGDISSTVVDMALRAYRSATEDHDLVRVRSVPVAEIQTADFSFDPARYLPAEAEAPERPLDDLVAELRDAQARRDRAAERLARAFRNLITNESNADTLNPQHAGSRR